MFQNSKFSFSTINQCQPRLFDAREGPHFMGKIPHGRVFWPHALAVDWLIDTASPVLLCFCFFILLSASSQFSIASVCKIDWIDERQFFMCRFYWKRDHEHSSEKSDVDGKACHWCGRQKVTGKIAGKRWKDQKGKESVSWRAEKEGERKRRISVHREIVLLRARRTSRSATRSESY